LDQWETIRLRCVRDGEPIKLVARELRLSKNTVRKYVRSLRAPQHGGIERECRLAPYRYHIDGWLRQSPRITAVRIGALLRERVDEDLQISERSLREYVANRRREIVAREAFVRALYVPGDQMQFDFTPVKLILCGVLTVVQLFVARLSYSGKLFARVSLHADQPALFAGLLGAVVHFGGVPRVGVFDNAKIAVVKILRGRNREENEAFRAFCGGLALAVEFAAPAKGNEKGGVEGAHGYIEDNFFRPIPSYLGLDELNTGLVAFCDASLGREHTTHRETIGARFAREQSALQQLPVALPRACINRYARINKFSEICFERNWYSVPTRYAHRDAVVEVYENHLRVIVENDCVAEHRRGFAAHERFLDPRHYVTLLQHKHRAAESALVLADGRIPTVLRELFERYREAEPNSATKRWTEVLALLTDSPVEVLAQAVTHALARGTDDPAAIALLVRQHSSPAPAAMLERRALPQPAQIAMPTSDLSAYATLQLMEGAA